MILLDAGRRSILKFAEYHGLDVQQVGCCREEKSDFSKEQIGRMYGVEGTPPKKLEKSKN